MPAVSDLNVISNGVRLFVQLSFYPLGFIFVPLSGKYEVRLPKYKGINNQQPPRFLVPLKPHVVILGFDCQMSCAVTGYPAPKVTWHKDGKNISKDPAFSSKNDFGICSLMIPGVTPADAGQYMVVAINELGEANSKAELAIKGKVENSRTQGWEPLQ